MHAMLIVFAGTLCTRMHNVQEKCIIMLCMFLQSEAIMHVALAALHAKVLHHI